MSTWTTCLRITRTDGYAIGLTSLDRELVVDGHTYISAASYTPSNLSTTSTLAASYADIEGILGVAGVNRNEIRAGLYDFAEILLFVYDFENKFIVRTIAIGNWGESTLLDDRYVAEFRSLSQRLQKNVGRLYTATCSAQFGDERCGVNLSGYSTTGTLTSVTSRLTVKDSSKAGLAGTWNGGLMTFTSGINAGRRFDISTSDADGTFNLFLPLSFPASAGDTYSLQRGCDKRLETCRDVYNNLINFRGFPHVPGAIKILKVGKH